MAIMAIAVHHARSQVTLDVARSKATHSATFYTNPETSQDPGVSWYVENTSQLPCSLSRRNHLNMSLNKHI